MNYRNSKQRDAIFLLLSKKNFHPTVDEIYDIVRKEYPHTSLATVYRNVDQLCRMGKIWKVPHSGAVARYDGNMEPHSHITCEECGSVQDVRLNSKIEEHIDLEESVPGHFLTGYSIDFYGICRTCKNDGDNSARETRQIRGNFFTVT